MSIEDSRLIMVSNRGPIEHSVDDSGKIRSKKTGDGVAVALSSAARSVPVTWIAGAATYGDQIVSLTGQALSLGDKGRLRLVNMPDEVRAPFYEVFCNPVLWFVQHSLSHLLDCSRNDAAVEDAWNTGYLPANELFAAAVIDEIGPDDRSARVMLHDYHLYTAPRLIREARPGVAMQQFIHIPWPEPLAWFILPEAIVSDICSGLLANDSVQFQSERDAANFMATCRAFLGEIADVYERRGEIEYLGRVTSVSANPISVDVAELEQLGSSPQVQFARDAIRLCATTDSRPEANKPIRTERGDRIKTIVRVDRLEPSKNILRGFLAYERLLEETPSLRKNVRFVAHLVPSRTGIAECDDYANRVFALVDQINDCYGTPEWQPITVIHKQDRLSALGSLSAYDVLLVNSVADGMNLVSKEGPILNRRDGVLVLSKSAGSYEELGRHAIGIEPLDVPETALALKMALELPEHERAARAAALKAIIAAHQIEDWLGEQLSDLEITSYLHQIEARFAPSQKLPVAVASRAG